MANQIIPQRSEVPEEYTWNLKDLYESDQAWNEEYKALKTLPEQITAFRGTLGRSAEDLLAWFRLQDQVEERLSRLYGYASCKGDEDTGNSFYQDMRGKAMSTLVTISSAAAFATPEIMEIPEDTLNLFYTAQPELERGGLRVIGLEDFHESHDITFLWRKGSVFAEQYQALFALLREEIPQTNS